MAVLCLLVTLAGCDGEDRDASPMTVATAPGGRATTTAPSDAPATARPARPRTDAPAHEQPPSPSAGQRRRLIDACRAQVRRSQLPPAAKADAERLCRASAAGDGEAVRRANRELCRELVARSVPAGPTREQALASCDRSAAVPAPDRRS